MACFEESLALHDKVWRVSGKIGRKPGFLTPHIRLGTTQYDLSDAALENITQLLPKTITLSPAEVQMNQEYRPYRQ